VTQPLRVICQPSVSDGFALAGIRTVPAVDSTEAAAVLGRLCDQAEPGVLLVEETLYAGLSEELRSALERRALPVVVPFPGPGAGRDERPSAESQLVELLRRAIGYRVRLR